VIWVCLPWPCQPVINVHFSLSLCAWRKTLLDPCDPLVQNGNRLLHDSVSVLRQLVVRVVLVHRDALADGLRTTVVAHHAEHIDVVASAGARSGNRVESLVAVLVIARLVVLPVNRETNLLVDEHVEVVGTRVVEALALAKDF